MPVTQTYPAPQADRLDKVCAVVDAVSGGAVTATAIASALDVVDRQGAYYANAAAYLGLVAAKDTVPITFDLTGEGAVFAQADTIGRVALLVDLVSQVPAVQVFCEADHAATVAYYESIGLDAETAGRRASTAGVWAKALTPGGLDVDAVACEADAARANAPAIAAALAAARARIPAPAPRCGTCHTELPRTGVCDYC